MTYQTKVKEFVKYDPTQKKQDGRRHQRSRYSTVFKQHNNPSVVERKGTWSNDRKHALLKAYVKFKPASAPYCEISKQWIKIKDAVNQVDTFLTPLQKQSVQNQFKEMMRHFEPIFSGKLSCCNQNFSSIEIAARKAYDVMKENDKTKSNQELNDVLLCGINQNNDSQRNGMDINLDETSTNTLVVENYTRINDESAVSSSETNSKILKALEILHQDNERLLKEFKILSRLLLTNK